MIEQEIQNLRRRDHGLSEVREVSSPIPLPLKLIKGEMSKENCISLFDNDVESLVSNTSFIQNKGGEFIDNQRSNLKDPEAYMRRW